MKLVSSAVARQSSQIWSIPVFLCPVVQSYRSLVPPWRSSVASQPARRRWLHAQNAEKQTSSLSSQGEKRHGLPWACPGCGAYYQSEDPNEPGYFAASKKPVRRFEATRSDYAQSNEPLAIAGALAHDAAGSQGTKASRTASAIETDEFPEEIVAESSPPPICDRCHNLRHHNRGASVIHPTIGAIRAMVSESPYKENHVWHVLDAADFPMSLVPRIQQELLLAPQRAQNRRAKPEWHSRRNKADMSFVIARSDLLAPRKEQVDAMMPYLTSVLRDALGPDGGRVRLGNVRCVSSHRGWWTKQVKDEVWHKGGGQWMVGKANVGKSQLLQNIFPKNRMQDAKTLDQHVETKGNGRAQHTTGKGLGLTSLLPPMPEETPYPILPLVSHLPGTTASPIRLPFGRGRGELIDLPGLPRGELEAHVLEAHRAELVMRSRKKAKQFSIKPGQSLVVSDLLRITPTAPDTVFLACPFIPLECHVTSTEKARSIVAQEDRAAVKGIAKPGVAALIKSAGEFPLRWDVTRARAGPLTRKDAVALRPEQLHFVVYSTDILIEGVGWIEIVAQVRKSALERQADGVKDVETNRGLPLVGFPAVEVFSPNGRHIDSRKPMGAWMLGGQKKKPVSQRTQRPRRSMKGVKKEMKREARALKERLGDGGK